MLFLCYNPIEPKNRDESMKRLVERGTGENAKVKLVGAWISLTQLEAWSVFEADDATEIMKFWHDWTDLNVNVLTPVVDFETLMKILPEEYGHSGGTKAG